VRRVNAVEPSDRETIRALFLHEGFDRVGFCSAAPVPDAVTPWVNAGHHASLEWMEHKPAKRSDPGLLLPGARTVICVAAAYPSTDARGAVAGYARGEDYHRTLKNALQRAAQAMEARFPGTATKVCVDTAPLLERAFAARAGLGWIGRNTMLDRTKRCMLLTKSTVSTCNILDRWSQILFLAINLNLFAADPSVMKVIQHLR